MTRSPLNRAAPDSGTNLTPRKTGPGDSFGSRSMGDRQWPDSQRRGDWNGGDGSWNGRPGGDRWYGDRDYGRYHHHHHGYPYHRYPYYGRYGCYRPYYCPPYYGSWYPWFVPTFSFGFGWGWDYPGYYSSYYPYYYSSPTVLYTEPAVVETVPVYGGTTYTEPSTVYYADPGTTYVETAPAAPPAGSSTTYVERSAPGATTTAPSPPPASQSEQARPVKEPDPRVIKAVTEGNEHFAAGRYPEAGKAYADAIAIDNTDGVARLLLGLTTFAQGDFATAAATMRQALDATPDLIWYPFNIKALYRDQTHFQEHLAALARHVDANPSDQEAQFLLGYMWYASGDAQNAKVIFGTLSVNNSSEQLYMALRDASAKAFEALSKQPQQAPAAPRS